MSRKPTQDKTDHGQNVGPAVNDKKVPATLCKSSKESGACGGHSASAVLPFANSACTQLVKAGLAVLAISIFFLLFQKRTLWRLHATSDQSLCGLARYARNVVRPFLEVFQIIPPILVVDSEGRLEISDGSSNCGRKLSDDSHATCQQVLVVHSFANSYNRPFVGSYAPPSCSFNRVSWNLTVVSAGKQFDRLGIVYLGDIEVFRTSTAEPNADGVQWTYLKDMTSYRSLLATDQKLIFDLGNAITHTYTASFNVTLTASYFTASDSVSPADAIVPVSKRNAWQNQPSAFMFPPENASNDIMLPINVKRAVFTIAATGQIEEEFWWSNVLQSDIHTFPHYGKLYGYSPFREIQLLIDGMLAGVAWPFPTIFTGGVVPGLWRPIVGIEAFDLKEYEIDITPWLPLLCDAHSHNFDIRVSGLTESDNGTIILSETVGSYWWITGKIFVWFDAKNHTTTGSGPYIASSASAFQVSSSVVQHANGSNETLRYHVDASRELNLHSTIDLAVGKKLVTWSQRLAFSNLGSYKEAGWLQETNQSSSGYDVSSSGYKKQYSYPLHVFSIEGSVRDNVTIAATVHYGKTERVFGYPVFPTGLEAFSEYETISGDLWEFETAEIATRQNGTAIYLGNRTDSTSFSFGTTQQELTFKGLRIDKGDPMKAFPSIIGTRELFERFVKSVNSTVIEDRANLVGTPVRHLRDSSHPVTQRRLCVFPRSRTCI